MREVVKNLTKQNYNDYDDDDDNDDDGDKFKSKFHKSLLI